MTAMGPAEELRLLQPFPLPALEALRLFLLASVSTSSTPSVQARNLVQRAYSTELHMLFADAIQRQQDPRALLPTARAPLSRISTALSANPRHLPLAIDELGQLGVTYPYLDVLRAHALSHDLRAQVAAACAVVLMAAVLLQ